MAFRKTITNSASGVSGNYVRLSTLRIDYNTRELSAQFQIYKDEQTARRADAQPALPQVMKLRLVGSQFDAVVGRAAVAQAARQGKDVVALIYEAAKTHEMISDFGSTPLNDAQKI